MATRKNILILLVLIANIQLGYSQEISDPLISVQTLKTIVDKMPEKTILLDVRTEKEFGAGYIKGAQNINFLSPSFDKIMEGKDKNLTYYVYCFSGGRSQQASTKLRDMGFTKIIDIDKGIRAWTQAGYALEK